MKVVDIWPFDVFPAFIFQSPLNANDHVVQKGFFQGIEGNKIEFIFPGYAEKGLVTASQIALADCILPQVTLVFTYIYSLINWKKECADMVGAF